MLNKLYRYYNYFASNPRVVIGDVANLFGVHRTTIWRNMRKLEQAGLIRSQIAEKTVQIEICRAWADNVAQGTQVQPRKPQKKRLDVALKTSSRQKSGTDVASGKIRDCAVRPDTVTRETADKSHTIPNRKASDRAGTSHVAYPASHGRAHKELSCFSKSPQLVSRESRATQPVQSTGTQSDCTEALSPDLHNGGLYELASRLFLPERVSRYKVRFAAAWIREHVDLSVYLEHIGVKVYKRNRSGENPCRCPLHGDRHPSLYVNRQKGIWYCHACNISGDAIEMIKQMRGLRFGDAARFVLRDIQVALFRGQAYFLTGNPRNALHDWLGQKSAPKGRHKRKETARGDSSITVELLRRQRHQQDQEYQSALSASAVGQAYLKQRGLTEETIRKYGLGFDPVRSAITLPNRDASGAVVGFTYRSLDGVEKDRYQNTANDVLYTKSAVVLGLHQVAERARYTGQLLLPEGGFDAFLLNQSGLSAGALQASSLSAEQISLIKRVVGDEVEIVLIPDNDKAGEKGLRKSMKLLDDQNVRYAIWRVPDEFEDVAEYLSEMGELADVSGLF